MLATNPVPGRDTQPMNGTILLAGTVGSTAYRLATPQSDVDTLGVFAAPTAAFHGLHTPEDTYTSKTPDVTYHEARKTCQLILSGNPTASEILWLPDYLYQVRTDLGEQLIGIRSKFLTAQRTRDAYLGYASSQFHRLSERPDNTFGSDLRKRTAKHARHLMRLCHQGYILYTTGRLVIELDNPQAFHDFGDRVAAGETAAAKDLIAEYKTKFDSARTVLPDRPDEAAVEQWLLAVRRAHL